MHLLLFSWHAWTPHFPLPLLCFCTLTSYCMPSRSQNPPPTPLTTSSLNTEETALPAAACTVPCHLLQALNLRTWYQRGSGCMVTTEAKKPQPQQQQQSYHKQFEKFLTVLNRSLLDESSSGMNGCCWKSLFQCQSGIFACQCQCLHKKHFHQSYFICSLDKLTSMYDIFKELVHDVGVQHSMQSSNKDSLLGVESDGGAFDVVSLVVHPRNHLHLLGLHAARRNLVLPVACAQHVLGAALQQQFYL